MSTYKTDQFRLIHQGREFHFVSYEGQRANVTRGQQEIPATWCLMSAGKRWTVMPQLSEQPAEEVEVQLHAWLEGHLAAHAN